MRSDDAVLVVGSTGALRPAVRTLTARGVRVLALARAGPRLAALAAEDVAVTAVPVDFRDLSSLERALPEHYCGALLYCPTASPAALELFAVRAGRVVQVLTSSAANPDRIGTAVNVASVPAAGVRVLLGWRADLTWHSPEEISAAAVASWDDGEDRVLGRLRPWTDRPALPRSEDEG